MIAAEQETTITYDNEEKIVRIFTARQADQTKMKRGGYSPTSGSKDRGFFYQVPLNRLRWRVVPLGFTSRRGNNLRNSTRTLSNPTRKGISE